MEEPAAPGGGEESSASQNSQSWPSWVEHARLATAAGSRDRGGVGWQVLLGLLSSEAPRPTLRTLSSAGSFDYIMSRYPVHEAAWLGRLDQLRRLLAADPAAAAAPDGGRRTPLHLAAMAGHCAAVEMLLQEAAPEAEQAASVQPAPIGMVGSYSTGLHRLHSAPLVHFARG